MIRPEPGQMFHGTKFQNLEYVFYKRERRIDSMKIILFHGTTEKNAMKIKEEGFVPDKKYNWNVKSKSGFVYLSSAYAPFYAMSAKGNSSKLAIIKVEVDTKDLYPEDDFVMIMMGKPKYTQEELDAVNLEKFKQHWKLSLGYMGNVAVKPDKIKILGMRIFGAKDLIWKCDPVICPMNFKVMGQYYSELTEWIYEGNDIKNFKNFMQEAIDFFKIKNSKIHGSNEHNNSKKEVGE